MVWIIGGVIVVLFIVAFLREGYRVPRVEKWFQLYGFVRLYTPLSEEVQTQLKRFVKMFGPLNRAWNFGFVFTWMKANSPLIVAEHDLKLPSGHRHWYTLFSLTAPNPFPGEFRVESMDQTAEGIRRIIEILLSPAFLVLKVFEPKHEEKEVLLTPVDFSEDAGFKQAYRVYGDGNAAKRLLTSEVRLALVQRRWKGEIAVADDTLVWRRKGLLNSACLDSLLSEIELMKALFLK